MAAPADIVAAPTQPARGANGPSLSREQRVQAAAARKVKQATIEEDIEGWYNDTVAFAEDLSSRFGSKPEHYLNMMFSGMFKLRATQRKPSAYNAWVHHLAKEHGNLNAKELVETFGEEYQDLTAEQKEQYVQELLEDRQDQLYGLRLGQRGRTQDVANVCKNIDDLFTGLQARVGIQGFYCIVRNNVEYQLKPRWFFTSPALEEFLRGAIRRFEPEKIGAMAEAFSIAGGDFLAQFNSNKEKVNFLKSEIRRLVAKGLVTITGDDDASMSYTQYVRDVQLKHGVTLVGWTHPKWCNPSDLGNSIEDLKTLRNALFDGSCHFARLSPLDKAVIQCQYDLDQREAPSRKKRSDAGKPRKQKGSRPAKRRRESSTDDEEREDDENDDNDE